jgi:DNA replication and repair protein RecF
LINGVDCGIYGSRGQQRTAALSLKLAEVDLMRNETGEQPVLLLDDVLSELDEHRRSFLVHTLENGVEQAIITTTDLHTLPQAFLSSSHLWRVEMGSLSKIAPEGPGANE